MKLPRLPSATETVVDFLAVARLTRLVQQDTVWPMPEIRDAVMNRHSDRRWAEVLDCAWCGSMWVAGAVALARRMFPRAWPVASRVLAGSAVAGHLAELGG